MTEEKKQSLQEISKKLCEAYNTLYLNHEVSFELGDVHADNLDRIVKTIEGTWFGFSHFNSYEKKATGYFCYIIRNHPVLDGNKRLAVLWLQGYCDEHNLKLGLPNGMNLDDLAVSVVEAKELDNETTLFLVRSILFGNRG